MTITLTITGETAEEFISNSRVLLPLAMVLGGNMTSAKDKADIAAAGPVPAEPTSEPEPAADKPKRTRRTKAEIEADKKAEEPKSEPAKADEGVDLAAIRKAGMALLEKFGPEDGTAKVAEVYKPFGAAKTSEIPEDKYADVLAGLQAALEG